MEKEHSQSIDERQARRLIRRARSGDDAAFGQLVMHYSQPLYRVVRRMTNDQAEAEAIVQEAFLRVWQNLHRYKDDRPFFPYLVAIALNIGRDQWRKSQRLDYRGLEPVEEYLAGDEPLLETQIEESETLHTLAQHVAELPLAYRTLIAMRYDAGMSYQEIAEALDLPINTIRRQLRRAKAILRKRFLNLEESHGK
jgi:RNA polymerase sigma-70 factor (ECF subfamily)